jgi:NADH dehydrogenase [ubiquinone] 1 alpha subcomplex assembly factor 7
MTSLERQIIGLIAQEGPISVGRYMEMCLCHYYANRDVFGPQGDFITAPEISQIFGELIGLWAANLWQIMEAPPAISLVELGPGRGTLMADALRAARVLPGFRAALRIHMLENSSALRGRQIKALEHELPSPVWHEAIDGLLDAHRGKPMILIANEFLDALPIRQYQRRDRAWRERHVGLGNDGRLGFGLHPLPVALTDAPANAPDGTIVERAEAAESVVVRIAAHIADNGGAALFIDYGSATSGFGDTLQAVKGHHPVDVFETPGEADLTAQVDFERMARAAQAAGAAIQPVAGQAAFLDALGIAARAERLCAKATPDQATALLAGVARLTDTSSPTAMGALFKVLCIRHPSLPPLPGMPA